MREFKIGDKVKWVDMHGSPDPEETYTIVHLKDGFARMYGRPDLGSIHVSHLRHALPTQEELDSLWQEFILETVDTDAIGQDPDYDKWTEKMEEMGACCVGYADPVPGGPNELKEILESALKFAECESTVVLLDPALDADSETHVFLFKA